MSERLTKASDLRAEIARRRAKIYVLAAGVGLHPSHLGQMLQGRRPLSPDVVERLWALLRAMPQDVEPSSDAWEGEIVDLARRYG